MYLTAFYSLPVHWRQRGIPLRMCPASGRDSRGQCVPGGPLSESRILCAGRGWQRCPAARWTAVSSSRLFHTGMRISEFCGLTLKDIDLENRTVNIDHQLQRTSDMRYIIETTKTDAGTRVLPITEDVAQMF